MKRLILGLTLLGYFGAAYSTDWVEFFTANDGTTGWVAKADVPGEYWTKTRFGYPQRRDGRLYNETLALSRVYCSNGSFSGVQINSYMDHVLVSSEPLQGTPTYGAPGTFGGALIGTICGK